MIEHKGNFTKNELAFIDSLDECFLKLFFADGAVEKTEDYIRYDICVGSADNQGLLTLQFCVRDNEDLEAGFSNFVHITYLYVPHKYRRRGVATRIIFLMSHVATQEVGIDTYVACHTSDPWKESLVSAGGMVDADGDVLIFYEPFMEHFKDKLTNPNYLT